LRYALASREWLDCAQFMTLTFRILWALRSCARLSWCRHSRSCVSCGQQQFAQVQAQGINRAGDPVAVADHSPSRTRAAVGGEALGGCIGGEGRQARRGYMFLMVGLFMVFFLLL
jgi:hypothetical protein